MRLRWDAGRDGGRALLITLAVAWLAVAGPATGPRGGTGGGPVPLDVSMFAETPGMAGAGTAMLAAAAEAHPAFRTYPIAGPPSAGAAPPPQDVGETADAADVPPPASARRPAARPAAGPGSARDGEPRASGPEIPPGAEPIEPGRPAARDGAGGDADPAAPAADDEPDVAVPGEPGPPSGSESPAEQPEAPEPAPPDGDPDAGAPDDPDGEPEPVTEGLGADGLRARLDDVHAAWAAEHRGAGEAFMAGLWWALLSSCVGEDVGGAPACGEAVAEAMARFETQPIDPSRWPQLAPAERDAGHTFALGALGRPEAGAHNTTTPTALPAWARQLPEVDR